MYYGISTTSAFKRCLSRIPHSFLKGLFVFVACPVLATRKAPRCQRFDCPQDLFFKLSNIIQQPLYYVYIRKSLYGEVRKGWDYHCNGVVSTLDSDRFSGAKARICIYNIKWSRYVEKKYLRGKEASLSACKILSLSTDLEIKVYGII